VQLFDNLLGSGRWSDNAVPNAGFQIGRAGLIVCLSSDYPI
jgi:hypothetical protein